MAQRRAVRAGRRRRQDEGLTALTWRSTHAPRVSYCMRTRASRLARRLAPRPRPCSRTELCICDGQRHHGRQYRRRQSAPCYVTDVSGRTRPSGRRTLPRRTMANERNPGRRHRRASPEARRARSARQSFPRTCRVRCVPRSRRPSRPRSDDPERRATSRRLGALHSAPPRRPLPPARPQSARSTARPSRSPRKLGCERRDPRSSEATARATHVAAACAGSALSHSSSRCLC